MNSALKTIQETKIDAVALRRYRLNRVRAELDKRDLAGALLYDPVNIRYVTDVSNMQVYSLHNPCRYVFVATDGPVVLFDFKHFIGKDKQSQTHNKQRRH